MLAIQPRAHTLLVLVLLLLITTLLLLLLHADPAQALADPNEPANNDVVTATHLAWWVQVESLIGHAGDTDLFDIPAPAAG